MKIKSIMLGSLLAGASLYANANPTPANDRVTVKKYDINGNVYSNAKRPIRDVSITAYLSSKKEKVTITDSNGLYAFDGLKPGLYKLVFEKDGFKRVTKEKVFIKTDEPFQLDIEMIEVSDFNFLPAPFNFSVMK